MHPPIDHVAEEVDHLGPHTRSTGGQRVGSEHQDRAHDVLGQRRPDADGMASHHVALQGSQLVVRDAHRRQVAEPCVDPINGIVRLGDLRDDLRRLLDLALRGPVEAHRYVAARDGDDVRDAEVVTGEPECGYFKFSRYQAPSFV